MKKKYLWTVIVAAVCIIYMLLSYFTYCESDLNICFWSVNYAFLRTLFHLCFVLFIATLLFVFVSDYVFMKWTRSVLFFIPLFFFLVYISPEFQPIVSILPGRKTMTVFLDKVFLIVSVILIIVWSIKRKEK